MANPYEVYRAIQRIEETYPIVVETLVLLKAKTRLLDKLLSKYKASLEDYIYDVEEDLVAAAPMELSEEEQEEALSAIQAWADEWRTSIDTDISPKGFDLDELLSLPFRLPKLRLLDVPVWPEEP